ncbi:hypothetical protein N9L23_06410, partial [Alphaproteobacteria bacterium]|nr:hypothetical protein [Alphaproteobacteria bacterium]
TAASLCASIFIVALSDAIGSLANQKTESSDAEQFITGFLVFTLISVLLIYFFDITVTGYLSSILIIGLLLITLSLKYSPIALSSLRKSPKKVLITVFFLSLFTVLVVSGHQVHYDARVNHLFVSKLLFLHGDLSSAKIEYDRSNIHQLGGVYWHYPKLISFLSASFCKMIGVWNDYTAIAGQTIFCQALILGTLRFFKIAQQAFFFFLIFLCMGSNIYVGYLDTHIALLCATIAIVVSALGARASYVLMLAAIVPFIKLEGVFFATGLYLCLQLQQQKSGGFLWVFAKEERWKSFIVLVAGLVFILQYFAFNDQSDTRLVLNTDLTSIFQRFILIFDFFLRDQTGILLVALGLLILSNFNKSYQGKWLLWSSGCISCCVAGYLMLMGGDMTYFNFILNYGGPRVVHGVYALLLFGLACEVWSFTTKKSGDKQALNT